MDLRSVIEEAYKERVKKLFDNFCTNIIDDQVIHYKDSPLARFKTGLSNADNAYKQAMDYIEQCKK